MTSRWRGRWRGQGGCVRRGIQEGQDGEEAQTWHSGCLGSSLDGAALQSSGQSSVGRVEGDWGEPGSPDCAAGPGVWEEGRTEGAQEQREPCWGWVGPGQEGWGCPRSWVELVHTPGSVLLTGGACFPGWVGPCWKQLCPLASDPPNLMAELGLDLGGSPQRNPGTAGGHPEGQC